MPKPLIDTVTMNLFQEFFVPPAAVYNSSSAHFLSALRQNVHIWDATSGEYIRKLTNVSPRYDPDADNAPPLYKLLKTRSCVRLALLGILHGGV